MPDKKLTLKDFCWQYGVELPKKVRCPIVDPTTDCNKCPIKDGCAPSYPSDRDSTYNKALADISNLDISTALQRYVEELSQPQTP